jgi:type IV pilus assembly protein PilB
MATPPPNNPNPPRKPTPLSGRPTPPQGLPAAKGGAPKPGSKAPAPGAKPPAAATGGGGAAKPPASKKTAKGGGWSGDSGTKKLGQIMVEMGFLDESQLFDVLEDARSNGIKVGQAALERGIINEDQLLRAIAEQAGMRVVNLEEAKPRPDAIRMVTQAMAELYKVLPLSYDNDILTVALADPQNVAALDDLRNFLGVSKVEGVLAHQKLIDEGISRAYMDKGETIGDIIALLEADGKLGKVRHETSIDLDSLMEIQDAAPVRKLINMVLLLAIKDKASDIHFEPFEDEYKMRYRCDGVLYEMVPPPRHLAMAIASRIKVMANLDIAERRLPQDGRIELNVGGNPVDMRVSILPTMFGESVVIRVLDRTVVNLDLDAIGMEDDMLKEFRRVMEKPNGILLVTGPTGAGKTTTLYSALSELNTITDKLITTEDPVEYEIDGIVQVPINSEIGMTFAAALRAILRQDPDRILVGEIRDLETAQLAIQASLTGHMVFSTLHTNDAPSTITRLRDMGIEPYLITATVEGILAQRLVRRICKNCKTPYTPSADQLIELNLKPEDLKGRPFYYGEGCDVCNNLGFKGRGGIYEFLVMTNELRDLISANASTDALRSYVRQRKISSLREAGLRALYAGLTTIDEVVRETVVDEEG